MSAALPRQAQAYHQAAKAHLEQGRLQDADRVLREATDHFPDDTGLLIAWAMIAQQQADWREAVRRWQCVQSRFPGLARGYFGAGHALRHLDQCDAADEVTEAGLAVLPDDLELLISRAWTAMVRRDYEQAARRWQIVMTIHPRSSHGYTGLAEALRCQSQMDDAETVLLCGMAALPEEPSIAEAFAMCATQRREWTAAVQRWRRAVARFPDSGACYFQLGIALKQTGEMEAAEIILAQGAQRVPDYLALAMEYAWCANARRDWAEALRRWGSLVARFPNDAAVREGFLCASLGDGDAAEAEVIASLGQLTADTVPSRSSAEPEGAPPAAHGVREHR